MIQRITLKILVVFYLKQKDLKFRLMVFNIHFCRDESKLNLMCFSTVSHLENPHGGYLYPELCGTLQVGPC